MKRNLITITIYTLPTTAYTREYEINYLFHQKNKKIKDTFSMAVSGELPNKYIRIVDMKPRLQKDLDKRVEKEFLTATLINIKKTFTKISKT